MDKSQDLESTGNPSEGQEEDEDDDDEEGKLFIVTDRPRRRCTATKKAETNDSDDLGIDKSIEEKLRHCAKKKDLSDAEMRNLLRTVANNDHVLALVKVQEKSSIKATDGDNDDDNEINAESDSKNLSTPKLTRSKAKALNHMPLPIVPLSGVQPKPEVAALITEDLPSDEEDEEYEPREEEYASDDDTNVTASDFDSHPNTPMTPGTYLDEDPNCSRYTDDGLFKLPRELNDSIASSHCELISQRTRSKMCLQETPIESIESKFVPPDIPTDMFDVDMDMDMDNAWAEFLTNFSKPLNTHAEEDDETDPEYVAADTEPIDSEELKNVNISKKELNDLVAELFDGLVQEGVILEDIHLGSPKKSPGKTPQKRKTRSDPKSELNSPEPVLNPYGPDLIAQPPIIMPTTSQVIVTQTPMGLAVEETSAINPKEVSFNKTIASMNESQDPNVTNTTQQTPFKPNVMSTPSSLPNQTIQSSQIAANPHSSSTGPVIISNEKLKTQLILSDSVDGGNAYDAGLLPAKGGSQPVQYLLANGTDSNGVYTLIPVNLAYMSPTKTRATFIPVHNTSESNTSASLVNFSVGETIVNDSSTKQTSSTVNEPPTSNEVASVKSNVACVSGTQRQTKKEANKPGNTAIAAIPPTPKSLENNATLPNPMVHRPRQCDLFEKYQEKFDSVKKVEVPTEPEAVPSAEGFTDIQLSILQQQLRMHVQLVSQNFLQVYSHPMYWKYANTLKNMLLEFDKHWTLAKPSIYVIWNLKLALQLIQDWEKELSVNSPENTAFMEYIYNEIERSRRCLKLPRIAPRIMETIMYNQVFLYPDLLPHVAFAPIEPPRYYEFIPSVDVLLANCLHYTYREIQEYNERCRPHCSKDITLTKVCRYIDSLKFFPRSAHALRDYIAKRMNDKSGYNPIKYFFQHRKPMPFTHVLYEVDFDDVKTPGERTSVLPKVWQEFAIKLNAQSELRNLKKKTNPCEYNRETTSSVLLKQNTSNITIHVNYVLDEQLNPKSVQCNSTSNQDTRTIYTPIPNAECNTSRIDELTEPPVLADPPPVTIEVPLLQIPPAPQPPASKQFSSQISETSSYQTSTQIPAQQFAPVSSSAQLRHADSVPPSHQPITQLVHPLPSASLPPEAFTASHQSFTQISHIAPVPSLPPPQHTSTHFPDSVPFREVFYVPPEDKSSPPSSYQSPKVEVSFSQRSNQTEFKYFTQIHDPLSSTRYNESRSWCKLPGNYQSPSISPTNSIRSVPEPHAETYTEKPPILINNSAVQNSRESLRFIDSWESVNRSANYSRYLAEIHKFHEPLLPKGQKLVTDYFKARRPNSPAKLNRSRLRQKYVNEKRRKLRKRRRFFLKTLKRRSLLRTQVRQRVVHLLSTYRNSFPQIRYKNAILNRLFNSLRALELYITFLTDLEMNVKKMKMAEECPGKKPTTTKATSGDEEVPKARKPYRVGESLRQMLLPESKEDTNEKDATFAMNFYDKVEETLCNAGHHERYESFQQILRKFDPHKERVADLYYKMENLFLPEYSHLAEIFLAFLLPSEAIEIGKFFEHFMITNMSTFVNKLNIFFNKQPAQIKKIYAALGELAEEQDLSVEMVKNKILPLLKGNKVLTDWFLQTFESEKPNQSISNVYETINLKQIESQNGEGEIHETVQLKDIIEESVNPNACQLKYINGGIYYGSRILLPANLNFLATELSKCSDEETDMASDVDPRLGESPRSCVHGFRECAEKQIKNHLEKNEEEKKTEEELDKDKDKYTLCDDLTFKAHAARLNPALYQAPPHHHMPTSLRSRHDGEISPKKQCLQKRRSPKKSLPKSPTAGSKKPSTVAASIPESSKAIGIAKKLKTITNGNDQTAESASNTKRRKQQKCMKPPTNEHTTESSYQSSSESATSDCEREPKRKQTKLQSPAANTSLSLSTPDDVAQSTSMDTTPFIITPKIEPVTPSPTPSPTPTPIESASNVWTRDEDKIILEEVKSGYDNEATLVARLLVKLPQRTEFEIVKRHQFLMEVLTQLQGKTS